MKAYLNAKEYSRCVRTFYDLISNAKRRPTEIHWTMLLSAYKWKMVDAVAQRTTDIDTDTDERMREWLGRLAQTEGCGRGVERRAEEGRGLRKVG